MMDSLTVTQKLCMIKAGRLIDITAKAGIRNQMEC